MKKYLIYFGIVILVIGFIVAIAYVKVANNNQTTTAATTAETYFSDEATVWYFYSTNCTHCVEEKSILAALAKEGFRVKPINVLEGENFKLATDNKITGTPAFLSQKDGEKLIGFQEIDVLRDWLTNHQ